MDATQLATIFLEAECGLPAHLGFPLSSQRDLDLELVEGTNGEERKKEPIFPTH